MVCAPFHLLVRARTASLALLAFQVGHALNKAANFAVLFRNRLGRHGGFETVVQPLENFAIQRVSGGIPGRRLSQPSMQLSRKPQINGDDVALLHGGTTSGTYRWP